MNKEATGRESVALLPRSIDFRARYFALLAFDGSPANVGQRVTLTTSERLPVLVWFPDERTFQAWYDSLKPGSIEGTFAIRENPAKPKTVVEAGIGWLPVRMLKEIRESPRLDLRELQAVELCTSSQRLLIASEHKEELVKWENALLDEMHVCCTTPCLAARPS